MDNNSTYFNLVTEKPNHNSHPQTINHVDFETRGEDSHNIRHISDFHFPLTYKGMVWSYGITMYDASYAAYTCICMVHDLFRTRIRYLCPKKDILSLTKNIAKFQSIDRVYHTKSLK